MSELHPATRAFAGAARYERGRPGYPASAVEHIVSKLGLRPGRTVLDLAAGTGKLTRLLGPSGATVIAVEPVAEMRKALAELVPGVRAFDGTAERILLGDSTVDAVTVAQAFHWFLHDDALREIHRVLRPEGGLALVWNARDEGHPVHAAISEIIDPLEGDTPRRTHWQWDAVLAGSGLFARYEHAVFTHEQVVDEQGIVERVSSISFVATAPDDIRAGVEHRVRALAHSVELPLHLPYTTEVDIAYAV